MQKNSFLFGFYAKKIQVNRKQWKAQEERNDHTTKKHWKRDKTLIFFFISSAIHYVKFKAYLPGTKVNDPSMDPWEHGRGVQLS